MFPCDFFPPPSLSLLTSLFVSRVTISKKYSHSFKAGEKYGARAIRGTNEPRSNLLKTCFSTTVGKRKRWFAVNPLVFFLSLAKLRSKRAQLTRTCVFFINRGRDPVKIWIGWKAEIRPSLECLCSQINGNWIGWNWLRYTRNMMKQSSWWWVVSLWRRTHRVVESKWQTDRLDEEYRIVMKLNALNYPDIGNYPEKGRNIDLTRIYS